MTLYQNGTTHTAYITDYLIVCTEWNLRLRFVSVSKLTQALELSGNKW